jgi:cytochrome c oxidase cbb3-type subunit 1
VKATYPFYAIRLLGGTMFLAGMLIMAYNTWKTVVGGKAVDAPVLAPAHA